MTEPNLASTTGERRARAQKGSTTRKREPTKMGGDLFPDPILHSRMDVLSERSPVPSLCAEFSYSVVTAPQLLSDVVMAEVLERLHLSPGGAEWILGPWAVVALVLGLPAASKTSVCAIPTAVRRTLRSLLSVRMSPSVPRPGTSGTWWDLEPARHSRAAPHTSPLGRCRHPNP